jgi:uncharacterized protein DUF2510
MPLSKLAGPRRKSVQRTVGTDTMPDRGDNMGKPLAPGWYPDPNGKAGNKLYWDGEDWRTASHLHRLPGS